MSESTANHNAFGSPLLASIIAGGMILAGAPAQDPSAATPQPSLRDILLDTKDTSPLAPVLEQTDTFRLQLAVAVPVAQPDGSVTLARQTHGDLGQYFYPASSIKLCAAVAALLMINEHNRSASHPLDWDTPYQVQERFPGDPPQGERGNTNLLRALRALFLVSDNQAFNDLYEMVGHRELNERMHGAGFGSIRLFHRLSEFRSVAQHRQTRAVVFAAGGNAAHTFPQRDSDLILRSSFDRGLDVGTGFYRDGKLVDEPMSFRQKNAAHLIALQDLLAAVVRPEVRLGRIGFPGLSVAQRQCLIQSLGMLPRESDGPRYNPKTYPDRYAKFLLPGVRRVIPARHARVYTKIGRAYGFSTTNAYVEDQRTGRGVFVAAVIYTNADGVLNDNAYEYDTVADPFFADLGEAIALAFLKPR